MLDGSAIAAILTGILALFGVLATAWTSGWNEARTQKHQARKALAQFSVPLLGAAWDLANLFYEILDDDNYSPQRCKAYGDGWNSEFTSYLLGQYFASVHIIREMTTHFFGNKDKRAAMLKKLLFKIQDEFVSMHYEGRQSLEMRWFEGDIKAAQEVLTVAADVDGDGKAGELRTIGWIEFRDRYAAGSTSNEGGPQWLKESFRWYDHDFQRIVFRRFLHLYSTKWLGSENPQNPEKMQANHTSEVEIKRIIDELKQVEEEQLLDPHCGIVIPDHRLRRLQHLLCDLVGLLDQVSNMEFNRPIRRCGMLQSPPRVAEDNPLGLLTKERVPCDCFNIECNPGQEDFDHRHFRLTKEQQGFERRHILRTESSLGQMGHFGAGDLRSRKSDLARPREKVDKSVC